MSKQGYLANLKSLARGFYFVYHYFDLKAVSHKSLNNVLLTYFIYVFILGLNIQPNVAISKSCRIELTFQTICNLNYRMVDTKYI